MPGIFALPPIQIDRQWMILFRTPLPMRSGDQLSRYAERFNVHARMEDVGSRFIARDESAVLELFHASDSLWWTQLTDVREEPSGVIEFPPEDRAIALAETFLLEHELLDTRASARSVTHTRACRTDRETDEAQDILTALHINFSFALDGLPVMGTGAKMRVSLGANARVIEVYRFWREPIEDRVVKILTPEEAVDTLRRDPAYSHLRDGEATIVIHRAQLGYLALPPREVQSHLVPVYAFSGTASTPYLRSYDFTKYVVAARFTALEAKRLGCSFGAPAATLWTI